MSGRVGWLALGAAAFLVFALALFPAATAYRWFAPDELRLIGVQGTVWNGRAALGSVGGLALRDVRWQLSPLALIVARVSASFDARLADGFLRGETQARLGGRLRLSNLQVSTSLPTLRDLLPLADTEGLASVNVTRLDMERGWPVDAAGEVRVAELQVAPLIPAGGPLIPLGSYALTFTGTGGDGVAGDLRDTGGPLEVAGTLELGRDRSYRLEGYARPRPEASVELLQGLDFMTEDPDPAGRRAFLFTGSL